MLGLTAAILCADVIRGDDPADASGDEVSMALAEAIDTIVDEAAVGPMAELCSDADFVRRAHLDLVGMIPTSEQVRVFLADVGEHRRERLVEELMKSRAFVRQMGLVAREVQAVAPEAVVEAEGVLRLAYGNLVGLLVEAIKDLGREVEQLKGAKE